MGRRLATVMTSCAARVRDCLLALGAAVAIAPGAAAQEGDFMLGKGTHDPSLNANSYPMTDMDRFPSAVLVRVARVRVVRRLGVQQFAHGQRLNRHRGRLLACCRRDLGGAREAGTDVRHGLVDRNHDLERRRLTLSSILRRRLDRAVADLRDVALEGPVRHRVDGDLRRLSELHRRDFGLVDLDLGLEQRHIGDRHALMASVLTVTATNAIYYLIAEPSMSHNSSLFAVSLLIFLWLQFRSTMTPRRWVLLGLAGGLVALVRLPDTTFLLLPILDSLSTIRADIRGVIRGWILYALGFFVYLDAKPPLGPATVPTALTFGTVIAILALIRLRERSTEADEADEHLGEIEAQPEWDGLQSVPASGTD